MTLPLNRAVPALVFFLLASLACSKNQAAKSRSLQTAEKSKAVSLSEEEASARKESQPSPSPKSEVRPLLPLKLIRTGTLGLEVANFDKAAAELARMAQASGGYVADSQATRSYTGQQRGTIVLRIPSERFDSTGDSVRTLGKVLSAHNSVQDVTKVYADLEMRIKVKREASDRVREILRTKTSGMIDVLNVERELSRLIEEIESLEGERHYFDHQISLSTLTVELAEPEADLSFRPSSMEPLKEAFRDSGRVLSSSLGALLYFVVALAPWTALGWGIFYVVRRSVRRRRALKAEIKAEQKEA